MTAIVAVLQARCSSRRLPGKVLRPILGKPMLAHQIERILRSGRIDRLILATSTEASDDPLVSLGAQLGVSVHRGSLDDVLDRFYGAVKGLDVQHVVRLTGDCPLADPGVIDEVIDAHLTEGADYTSNALEPTWPDGLDVEVIKLGALRKAHTEATLTSDREHVTPYIYKHPALFKIVKHKQARDLSQLRWTVDEPVDFELVTAIYDALYPQNPRFGYTDVLRLIETRPELATMNTQHQRNAGYTASLQKEGSMSTRYQKSEELLSRALKTIPLGSQTFSKSKTQYPFGVSPFFIERGKGSTVWDVDGNEYTDFINSLCSVNLGYCDPDVDQAVAEQLKKGVIFSLPHPLETLVAEKLRELVPCAEMTRFGKNGSDATAGAIRLARAYTNRDHVAVCGYHGWQDWYIGSTARNRGVPKAVRELTHTFAYNDLGSLDAIFKAHPDGVAAVILEPMNVTDPKPGFLESVQKLCRDKGALLVFDETITGFRYNEGGAQKLFGVTPDLATFGKGMANGYPISAVAGRADVMKLMEEIFFSFTFGGETLSLAAALATMTKISSGKVIARMIETGTAVKSGVQELIGRHGLGDVLSTAGHPTWSFLLFKDVAPYTQWHLKTLFMQETLARGVLTLGTHNISYAHSRDDVQKLLATYDAVFAVLADAVKSKTLESKLRCEVLQPLFKVR
jgi:glutamate-1-semialdehyde aminotransferase/spore coat polysaccharide biosynthesis protein SpsF (cytidylyltransferase family)